MRRLVLMTLATVALAFAGGRTADAQYGYYGAGRMTWTGPNSYIYDATSYYRRPPLYYYPGYSYYGYGRDLPPYGFGSPYYSGYNDPYYGTYGPGVREFLRFGGADFYGW